VVVRDWVVVAVGATKKHASLRVALATASCSLLGLTPTVLLAGPDSAQVDGAFLYYSEKNRMTVVEAISIFTVPLATDESLTISPTLDVISGASPNGAIPTNKAQALGNTVTPAGELPTQQIIDIRYGLSLLWTNPNSRLSRSTLGADVSSENDYSSFGANYSRIWDLENRLTSFSAGLSVGRDTISPSTGVVYKGLTPLVLGDAQTTTRASDVGISSELPIKQTIDTLFGVTRVINRRTLMQFNYGIGGTAGYLTDPYKIISKVDRDTGETTGYFTEKRPSTRLRQTLFWKTIIHLPSDVIHLTYRHYWDDWQIKSDTFELNYYFKVGSSGYYIEPQLRYYTQTAASFFRYRIVEGEVMPQNASADLRLGEMKSYSYGIKFAAPLPNDGEISLRTVLIKQSGDSYPSDAIGVEREQNLNPSMEAIIVQLNLIFKL